MPDNITTVREMYSAFQRGDIPAIIGRLAEDVVWDDDGLPEVPWLAPRRGTGGAKAFFETLSAVRFDNFSVVSVVGDGPLVIGLLDIDCTVLVSGRRVIERDEVHIWKFNAAGRVTSFRHRVDTLRHLRALAP